MKALKTVLSAFLMVAFLVTLAGCEQSGSHGKGGHGHSHEWCRSGPEISCLRPFGT